MKRLCTRLLAAYNALFSRSFLVISHDQQGNLTAYSNVGHDEFNAMTEIVSQAFEDLEAEDSIENQVKEALNKKVN